MTMTSPQGEYLSSSPPPVSQFNVPLPSHLRTQISGLQDGFSRGASVSAQLGFSPGRDSIIHAPPSQKLLNLERDGRDRLGASGVKEEAHLDRMHAALQDLQDCSFDLHMSDRHMPTEEALVDIILLRVRRVNVNGWDQSALQKTDDTDTGLWDEYQVSLSWCDDHSTSNMKFATAQEMLKHIAEGQPIPSPAALSDDWSLLASIHDHHSDRSVITVHDCAKSEEVSRIPVRGTVKTLNFARDAAMLIACGQMRLDGDPSSWSIVIFNTTSGEALKKIAPETYAGDVRLMYELMGTFSNDNERIYSIVVHPEGDHRVVIRRLDKGALMSPTDHKAVRDVKVSEVDDTNEVFVSNALFSELTLCATQRSSHTVYAKGVKQCFKDVKTFPHSQVLCAEDCHVSQRGKQVWRATLVLRDGTVLHLQDSSQRYYSLLDPFLYVPVRNKNNYTHMSSRAKRVWPIQSLHEVLGKKNFAGPRGEYAADDGILNPNTSSVCQQGRILACVYNSRSKQGLGHRGVIVLPPHLLAEDQSGQNTMEGGILKLGQPQALEASGVPNCSQAASSAVVVTTDARSVVVWDLWHADLMHRVQHPRDVNSVHVSSDGKLLTVSVSGEVRGRRVGESFLQLRSLITCEPLWTLRLFVDVFHARIEEPQATSGAGRQAMQVSLSLSAAPDSQRWAVKTSEDEAAPWAVKGEGGGTKQKHIAVSDHLEVLCLVVEVHGIEELHLYYGEQARQARAHVMDIITEPSSSNPENASQTDPSTAGLSRQASTGSDKPGLKRGQSFLGGGASVMRAMAVSGSGDMVAMCFKKGPQRFINVLSTASLLEGRKERCRLVEMNIVFTPGLQVKAMCVYATGVAVAADLFSAEGVECSICHLNLLSQHGADPKMDVIKIAGETLALASNGNIRVARDQDRSIMVQSLQREELLYRFAPSKLDHMGISANGRRLIFPDPKKHDHQLVVKDLDIIHQFGPSIETFKYWTSKSGPDSPLNVVPKEMLHKWILLRRSLWAQPVSRILDRGLEGRDYSSLELLLAACPVLWAATPYMPDTHEAAHGRRTSTTALEMVQAEGASKAGLNMLELALTANDKLLLEMLLEAVVTCVKDRPEIAPVVHMEQVTTLVKRALHERKMLEKVDQFLKDLPLIKIAVPEEEVLATFPDGEVLSTFWGSHHVMTSASPWTFIKAEQGWQKFVPGEKGHRYVVALPGLADPLTLYEFTSSKVDPSLLDNESMRVTIDSLEQTMQVNIPRILTGGRQLSVDLQLSLYLIMLTCYCLFVYFATTRDLPLRELSRTRSGMLGIVAGMFAALINGYELVLEFFEFKAKGDKWGWLLVPWNILPLLGNTSSIVSLFLVLTFDEADDQWDRHATRAWSSVAMVLLWLHLFNYLRAYHKGTALVELLVEIMIDMVYFVGVTAVLIFAFSFGFFALHGNLEPQSLYGEAASWTDEQAAYAESNFQFSKLEQCIARTFTFAVLGAFDIDSFRSPVDMDSQGLLTNLSSVFFLMAAFLITIVALNALIAIMGNTYSRVAAQERAVVYKEIAAVLQDKVRLYVRDMANMRAFTRWTHVLSPSETGSIALGVGRKREEASMRRTLVTVAQDTKAIQRDLEGLRTQPAGEEMAKAVEEAAGKLVEEAVGRLHAEHQAAHAAQAAAHAAHAAAQAENVKALNQASAALGNVNLAALAAEVRAVDQKVEEGLAGLRASLERRFEAMASRMEKAVSERPPPKPGVAMTPMSSFPLVVLSDRSPAKQPESAEA